MKANEHYFLILWFPLLYMMVQYSFSVCGRNPNMMYRLYLCYATGSIPDGLRDLDHDTIIYFFSGIQLSVLKFSDNKVDVCDF